jgi:hypothetical protein
MLPVDQSLNSCLKHVAILWLFTAERPVYYQLEPELGSPPLKQSFLTVFPFLKRDQFRQSK